MDLSRRSLLLSAGAAAGLIGVAPALGHAGTVIPADSPTPPRGPGEGQGPFRKLVIRGVNLIVGAGGEVRGPVDVVVRGNRIEQIIPAGQPSRALPADRPPHDAEHEIDATGMWMMPGLVDEHTHTGTGSTPRTYAYKLWLGHGVTTVRGVSLAKNPDAVSDKERSERNEIVAPRIVNYQTPGSGWEGGPVDSPEKATRWVAWAARNGVDGIKFFGEGPYGRPEIEAAIKAARQSGLGTTMHHSPPIYPQLNALETGRLGLGTVTHFYGHFEALLKEGREHPKPPDYDYSNEASRWRAVAEVVNYTYPPGSAQWRSYLSQQLDNGVTFGPTLGVYLAGRDLLRTRGLEWHPRFVLPTLWNFWEPSPEAHGSFYYSWTSEDEASWKRFYVQYMQLVHDYKEMGGRIAGGTDPGFIYNLYGFANINELEMLREAGLTPLEAIEAMSSAAARTIADPTGRPPEYGSVVEGSIADLAILGENPLEDLKTLYGTGTPRLNQDTGDIARVGGVQWTIRNGVVYDAKRLLADVADMVQAQKSAGACGDVDPDWSMSGPCGGSPGVGVAPPAKPAKRAAPLP
ncbi:amidohydrolase [Saccharopolyspora sp. NPDC002686]|uniref:amidohydrolase family protein n=1 Tax=Saccharopolyspora sp. NPDC002686 TaxID=3154541 RepID=UPI00331784E1